MVSAGVRRAGRKPASASATVRVVKNSRPACPRVSGSVAVLLTWRRAGVRPGRRGPPGQAERADHRAQGHLAQAADGGLPQGLLELCDPPVPLARAAAVGQQVAEDPVRLRGTDPARDALAARLVPEEA